MAGKDSRDVYYTIKIILDMHVPLKINSPKVNIGSFITKEFQFNLRKNDRDIGN